MSVWKRIDEAFGFPGGAAKNSLHSRVIGVFGQDVSDAIALIEELLDAGKTSHQTAEEFQRFLTALDKDVKMYGYGKDDDQEGSKSSSPAPSKPSKGGLMGKADSWNRPATPLDYRPGDKK